MESESNINLENPDLDLVCTNPVKEESDMIETNCSSEVKPTQNEKLFTASFLILWQGQFISALGDVVYGIALGFWVLAVTGSTALMGSLMAASVLPGVLVSPFAGVFVDRIDRKRLLILMDFIRGLFMCLVSIAAFKGFLEIWMVFVAGVALSVCGAFFHPATNAIIPDIVPKSKLTNANSIFGMIFSGSNIIGSSLGGFIFQLVGAPIMFLFNGLSFIFSGSSISFVKIPKHVKAVKEQHFFTDMKDGFVFMWKFRGLRYMLIMASILNFFAYIAIVLFLPLFQRTEGLGPAKYGFAMAFFTGGMLLGMLITAIIHIPPIKRLLIYMGSSFISCICFIAFPQFHNFIIMCILLLAGGLLNAISNVFIMSSIQASTPENMRGKVFSLLSTVTQGLTPIAMAVGGVLAEFIPIKMVISLSFVIVFIIFVPFAFNMHFKRFINFDPKTQKLEDVL